MLNDLSVTALNATTYTAIELDYDGTYVCAYYAEVDGEFVPCYIADDADGTNEHTMIMPVSELVTVKNGVVFYAKSLVGTPNFVIKSGPKW